MTNTSILQSRMCRKETFSQATLCTSWSGTAFKRSFYIWQGRFWSLNDGLSHYSLHWPCKFGFDEGWLLNLLLIMEKNIIVNIVLFSYLRLFWNQKNDTSCCHVCEAIDLCCSSLFWCYDIECAFITSPFSSPCNTMFCHAKLNRIAWTR